MKHLILGIISTIFLFSCSQHSAEGNKTNSEKLVTENNAVRVVESFESDTTYEFQIIPSSADTLKLVSKSWYFYYPFGKFTSPAELTNHFKGSFEVIEESSPIYNNPSDLETLHRLKLKNGFVKFFHTTLSDGPEKDEMAIVSAKITDPAIQMTNGLKVGQTKDEVAKILFSKGEPNNFQNYQNIFIVTGLDGVYVHLRFDKDILKSIFIDTDYLLNKE